MVTLKNTGVPQSTEAVGFLLPPLWHPHRKFVARNGLEVQRHGHADADVCLPLDGGRRDDEVVRVVAHQVNLENAVGSLGRERGRVTVTEEEGPSTAVGEAVGQHRTAAPMRWQSVCIGRKPARASSVGTALHLQTHENAITGDVRESFSARVWLTESQGSALTLSALGCMFLCLLGVQRM